VCVCEGGRRCRGWEELGVFGVRRFHGGFLEVRAKRPTFVHDDRAPHHAREGAFHLLPRHGVVRREDLRCARVRRMCVYMCMVHVCVCVCVCVCFSARYNIYAHDNMMI